MASRKDPIMVWQIRGCQVNSHIYFIVECLLKADATQWLLTNFYVVVVTPQSYIVSRLYMYFISSTSLSYQILWNGQSRNSLLTAPWHYLTQVQSDDVHDFHTEEAHHL